MLALFAALLCVVANAFFVAAEFALARVRPTALEALARNGDALAVRALAITKRLDAYLTATQFGITLASLGLGWLGEPVLADLIAAPLLDVGLSERGVHAVAATLAFATISMLHIVIGELVPKSLAIVYPAEVARQTAWPMTIFYYAAYPALVGLTRLSNALLRSAGVHGVTDVTGKLTAEEIELIVGASFGEGDKLKRELLERVLRATDRPVRSLMIPRVDMYTLNLTDSLEQWSDSVRKTGFSRYPVTDHGDPDRIVGYVYVKDLLLAQHPAKGGSRAVTRDILFLPETLSVGAALTRFQHSSIPIAIVVDEYGGTSGLVTVEDVVEELVGDIHDELDVAKPAIETREDGTLIAAGSVLVADLPIEGFIVDGNRGDTISGFILDQLGRLAHPGDRISLGHHEVTVEDVRRRRIWRVAIRRREPTVRPGTPAPSMPPPPDIEDRDG